MAPYTQARAGQFMAIVRHRDPIVNAERHSEMES
jgi:hypothetical protein